MAQVLGAGQHYVYLQFVHAAIRALPVLTGVLDGAAKYSHTSPSEPRVLDPQGLLALRLQFTLPSATYATMLIRELTKQSTATAVHRAKTLAAAPAAAAAGSDATALRALTS